MQLTHGLHRSAQIGRDKIATTFGARRRTWGEMRDRVARLAHGLAKLGVKPDDRVAMLGLNSDRYVETYYAIAWAGAVAVPGNTRWSPAEHTYGFEDSTPSLVLADKTFAALTASLVKQRPMPFVYMDDGAPPDGAVSYEALIAENTPLEDRCGRDHDLCGIFYTGGTTGHPKGVMLSHNSLMMNALYANATGRYKAGTRMLHVAPLFHMAGFGSFLGTTFAGGSHVIVSGFDPAAVIKGFVEQGANGALFVPTMFTLLFQYLEKNPTDLSMVESITYGASPISEAVLQRAMKTFPNAGFTQGYGQSELGPLATTLTPEFHLPEGNRPAKLRSAGRAPPGVDVKVADDAQNELPRGEVGEVVVRHDGIMLGYWNKPDLTAATIVKGWVRTGDAAYMDEDGFLFIVDRLKDMVVSGGENVFSAEVENALASHPAVAECAVIGVPDERWGERVHAVVRLKDNTKATPDDLIAHCKTLIATYKCPRSVELRETALPLSAAGKILKTELRKPYWEGQKRQVG